MSKLEVNKQTVYFHSSEDLKEIKSNSVDFFITSPPYWDLKKYGNHPEQIGNEEYEKYLNRLNKVWDECFRVAKEGAVFVLNINSRRNKKILYPIAFDIYSRMKTWKLWDILIWYIPNALPQPNHYMERLFDNKFEYLLVFIKGGADKYTFHKPRVPQKYLFADPRVKNKNKNGRCMGNIIRIPAYRPPNIKKLSYHEAAYPEELVAIMLESFTNKGDIVLDPFTGSGTTLKVCNVMERAGVGFEINEAYKKLIEERIMEPWAVPDWKNLDLIHSTSGDAGVKNGPRKAHFRKRPLEESLF